MASASSPAPAGSPWSAAPAPANPRNPRASSSTIRTCDPPESPRPRREAGSPLPITRKRLSHDDSMLDSGSRGQSAVRRDPGGPRPVVEEGQREYRDRRGIGEAAGDPVQPGGGDRRRTTVQELGRPE